MYQLLFLGLSGLIIAALVGSLACAAFGQWRDFRIAYVSVWAAVAGSWIFAIAVPTGSHSSPSGEFSLQMFMISVAGGAAAAVTGILVLGIWAWRERK